MVASGCVGCSTVLVGEVLWPMLSAQMVFSHGVLRVLQQRAAAHGYGWRCKRGYAEAW
jgi:hypothetical protein